LIAGIERMFHRVHPTLGGYFNQMKRDNLLDLDNRKNKAPGGYCEIFRALRKPFIFANSVGIHDDVQTMLHEGGHAFHVFEAQSIPYAQQLDAPMEFAEVASMGMELLSAPYLAEEEGGFYSRQEANRARIEHLEANLRFWPYMAVVDAFQLWAYENPDAAGDSEQCDACWASLWGRFMHGVNWDGLDDVMITGWQRKLHIVEDPLYYIEYGMAQLGAAQIWHNALSDQADAVESYRKSLSLGGTVSLPELFKAAGARFAFDGDTLRGIVSLMETTITQLEGTARDDQN
jgi:oligoendopeptidase F